MKFSQYLQCLASGADQPAWVKPFDMVAAVLAMRRYARRIDARTKRLPNTAYGAYLRTPHWQRFRMAVLILSGGQCCRCGGVADHVHHRTYVRKGRERLEDVEPLCEPCHSSHHGKKVTT